MTSNNIKNSYKTYKKKKATVIRSNVDIIIVSHCASCFTFLVNLNMNYFTTKYTFLYLFQNLPRAILKINATN